MSKIQSLIDKKQERNAEYKETKQAEREELMAMLDSSIMDITSIPENYLAYLDFQAASNSRYSASNAALIMAQNPDASSVGTIDHWNKLGRRVVPNPESIKIMAPERYDYVKHHQQEDENGNITTVPERKRGTGFKFLNVYDVSQTAGRPLSEKLHLGNSQEGQTKGIEALVNYCRVPLQVDTEMPEAALYDSQTMAIFVNEEYPEAEIFAALTNEIAHAELHGGGANTAYKHEEYEVYANSVAHVVCKRFGIEPPDMDLEQAIDEFSIYDKDGRRDVLDNLHAISKNMSEQVSRDVGVQMRPQAKATPARSAGTAR